MIPETPSQFCPTFSVLLFLCVFVSFIYISLIPMPLLWQEVFLVEAGPQLNIKSLC